MTSDLYFILNPSLGTIKIGIADDVKRRHQGLEHACGVPLDVLGVLADGAEFERALHDAFYDSRLLGEWFSPTEDLCALADDPSGVPAYVEQHEALIVQNRQRRTASQVAGLQESRQRRVAERDEELRVEILAAHAMAIREDRRRTRQAAKQAAREAAAQAAEIESKIAIYSKSPRVIDRLLAQELVAAADDRKATLARISDQRLRNAAFAGVRRAAVR